MRKFAKKVLKLIVAAGLALAVAVPAVGCDSKPTLNVYNWEDYIAEGIIKEFEEETGCTVKYSRFATNEEMYAKIKGGGGGAYDVVFPSDYMIERMIEEDMLAEIDVNALENYSHIMPSKLSMGYDPDNKYSVPYMWGTLGIIYDMEKVAEPVESWNILWDEKYKDEVIMMDSIRDSIGITLKMLDYSLNTRDQNALEAAKQKLIEQKLSGVVKAYLGDDTKDKMARGEATFAVLYSGDAATTIERNENLAYVVPKEGSNIWFDGVAILKDAKNYDLAVKFIDFLCRPDIAERNADFIGYSTPNQTAYDMMDEETQTDPTRYPDEAIVERCEVFNDLGEFTAQYEQIWNEVKTAR